MRLAIKVNLDIKVWHFSAQKGLSQDAEECSFLALKDNMPSINFYKKGGAKNVTQIGNFHVFRFRRPAIESISDTAIKYV